MAGECRPVPGAGCAALGQLKALAAAAELGFGGTLRASSLLLTREMRTGGGSPIEHSHRGVATQGTCGRRFMERRRAAK
ncbi:unnamed protein product [Prorocentrum cordatum]|uniref:Uncharacterized protein n=1 Tax=Prorocentrum cordatum TaxID=2364126 RepID=A0ABN9TPF9_9DINO|nr:unnamed protein product [Polarella glacialis]